MTKQANSNERHGLRERYRRRRPAADNASGLDLRPGTAVVAADGVVLGHVVQVWRGAELQSNGGVAGLDYVEVRQQDTVLYIPLEAVRALAEPEHTVQVEVSAEQATSGPWRYRPDGVPAAHEPGLLGQELPAMLDNPNQLQLGP